MALKIPDLYYVGNVDTNFIGFTFNGVHSSELGVLRVSDGSRYNENLLPTFQDKTVVTPGGHGTYFFNTNYTQRSFTLSFAFDQVTEQQLRKIKTWFNVDVPKELIFDEVPYKYYLVKPTGTPTIKYVCFEEVQDQRIYKGEGSVNLIGYYPFGISRALSYNDPIFEYIGNKIEWQDSSGLVREYDSNWNYLTNKKISNGGDFDTPLYITIQPTKRSETMDCTFILNFNFFLRFKISNLMLKNNDNIIRINSKNQLVEGGNYMGNNFQPSGNIYNEYIEGFFPILPVNEDNSYSILSCENAKNISTINVDYNLLYI